MVLRSRHIMSANSNAREAAMCRTLYPTTLAGLQAGRTSAFGTLTGSTTVIRRRAGNEICDESCCRPPISSTINTRSLRHAHEPKGTTVLRAATHTICDAPRQICQAHHD